MTNFFKDARQGMYGPWWGVLLYILAFTVFLPVTLLVRLVLFGRITDKETPLDKLKDKIVG